MGESGAPPAPPPDLPAGTVTFLFTDLEGSTRLLQAHPDAYREAVARHHALLRGAVEGHGGVVFETVGDAVYAAFARPTDAVAAALAGQVALQAANWGDLGPGALRARMALHTGEVEVQGGHYFGAPLYRAGRLLPAAHGGQVVLTGATAELVADALPAGAGLRDLGAHRLRDLQRPERVYQLLAAGVPGEFPPLRTLDALPHNLPLQLTSFVGRERELTEVAALLAASRLVTLTGPGGTGKTRLALQAAADALDGYPDGVWLAELAALADPALVPQAVAAAVGVREEPGRALLATLTDALRPKRLLLVLDNCEHLLEACARFADALLRACRDLRLLTTSREALGIAGETTWRVPSLAVPEAAAELAVASGAPLARYAAVRLFADRAAAARPGFRVTSQNAAAVAAICRRLDGIPLALELAAPKVRALPPAQLLARLEDRFRLLTGGSRTALPRQQTLQAAVDWSYDLLSGPEQALLARLSVFAGGFALEAAEAVCAGAGGDGGDALETVDLLTRLVDKSLVAAEELPDGTARYALLETLRQYAAERLDRRGERDALSERHRAWYLALGEQALQGYWLRADLPGWWERLAPEQANFRAALRFSLARGEPEPGLRVATGLWVLWAYRGPWAEGTDWIARLLALPGAAASPAARADALTVAGQMTFEQGDLAAARVLLLEAVDLQRRCGSARGLAMALDHAGLVASARGAFAAAHAFHEEALAIGRAAGNQGYAAVSLEARSMAAYLQGAYELARTLAEESLALRSALDPGGGSAGAEANIPLYILGRVALCTGDYAAARRRFEANLALGRGVGDARSNPAVGALVGLSCVAVAEGDQAQARALLGEALALSQRLGSGAGLASTLEGFAILATAADRPEHAVRLGGAAAALRATLHHPISPAEHAVLERWLGPARRLLGEEAATAAWAAGQALSAEQAVAAARTLDGEA